MKKYTLYRDNGRITLLKDVSADTIKLYLRLLMDKRIEIHNGDWPVGYSSWQEKMQKENWIVKHETKKHRKMEWTPDIFLHYTI